MTKKKPSPCASCVPWSLINHKNAVRPETWDHTALSDARDSIRHIRAAVGHDVPLMGVGFSFGGCLLTALAGSVPQEEHGLYGMVRAGTRTKGADSLGDREGLLMGG